MQRLKPYLRPFYAPFLRRYRLRAAVRKDQQRIRGSIQEALNAGAPVKLIIGAGRPKYDGWIHTDIPAFNVLDAGHWAQMAPRAAVDRILAEHVFEHLTAAQFGIFLDNAKPHLSAGGRIRIAVPDGHHPDADYIERVKPQGLGAGADDHKVLYTAELMGSVISERGYQFELLEYFDADGQFNRREWRQEDGFIGRSALHDWRNADGVLRYTSLIVDCWL